MCLAGLLVHPQKTVAVFGVFYGAKIGVLTVETRKKHFINLVYLDISGARFVSSFEC